MNLRFAFVALPLAALALSGCSKGSSSLATVSGDTITKDEFSEYLQTKPTVRVTINGQVVETNVSDTLAFQALQDMVTRKIVMQLAKDEKLVPTDKEVETEINFRKDLNPNFIKQLQGKGMSMGLIKRNVELEMSQERLLTKGITVTDDEVTDYINGHKAQFMESAKADMDWIFVKTPEKKAQCEAALNQGQSLKNVAKEYSDAPLAAQSEGKFGMSDLNALSPQLRAIIAKTEPGSQTDWIQADGGFAKFQVNSKTPAKPVEMTASKREFLKRQIAISRGQKANDLSQRVQERIRDAKIEVTDPALKDLWKAFVARVKEQAKNTKLPTDTNSDAKPAQ